VSLLRSPARATLFPYTTLFRSLAVTKQDERHAEHGPRERALAERLGATGDVPLTRQACDREMPFGGRRCENGERHAGGPIIDPCPRDVESARSDERLRKRGAPRIVRKRRAFAPRVIGSSRRPG